MRTTITFDRDVAAAIQRLRRERRVGLSAVVNELIRSGLRAQGKKVRFAQRGDDLGLHVDVRHVAGALELLEGPSRR
jgi:hypothetical protein